MSTSNAPTLVTLPVELLYRLLDHLDIQTILLSFRYVARTFYLITNSYRDYHLDLAIASKRHFHLITRLICPEHVVAITLSDDDTTPGQIGLFGSLFRIYDFPRLRSLTLCHIDSKELHDILNDLLQCSLTSLTILSSGQRRKPTLRLLSLLIAQSQLELLSLNTHAHHIEGIFESVTKSHLTRLTIGIVTFNEYLSVLRYCPHLRTLVIDDCWMADSEQCSSTKSYRHVKSLTLKDTNRSLAQLAVLFSLTPSLMTLELITSPLTPNSLIDGSHWETLINTKLAALTNFKFVFYQLHLRIYECSADVEPLIRPFRTTFWIEDKRWFVNCQSIKSSHTVKIFSVPFPISSFEYHLDSGNILLTTTTRKFNQVSIMERVRCLSLNLSEIKTKPIAKQEFLFVSVTELELRLHGEWPNDSLRFITLLVNLSKLHTLAFRGNFNRRTVVKTVDSLRTLTSQMTGLRSFTLLPFDANGQYHINMAVLCAVIPAHIEHLTWKIQIVDDMQLVLEKMHLLSSVSFNLPTDRKISCSEIVHWLVSNGRDFSHLEKDYSLHFWFGNRLL